VTPHLPPAITLALLVIVVTYGYVTTCIVWPFMNCRRCDGTGKTRSWINSRTFRICRRCDGNGRRLRTGRKVWNFFHRLHGDAR
jgi:hypothetical protein